MDLLRVTCKQTTRTHFCFQIQVATLSALKLFWRGGNNGFVGITTRGHEQVLFTNPSTCIDHNMGKKVALRRR